MCKCLLWKHCERHLLQTWTIISIEFLSVQWCSREIGKSPAHGSIKCTGSLPRGFPGQIPLWLIFSWTIIMVKAYTSIRLYLRVYWNMHLRLDYMVRNLLFDNPGFAKGWCNNYVAIKSLLRMNLCVCVCACVCVCVHAHACMCLCTCVHGCHMALVFNY